MYCSSIGMSVSATSSALGLCRHTVIDWYNIVREECTAKLIRMSMEDRMLVGAGHIVEIDKYLMIKRKYNRGIIESSANNGFPECTIGKLERVL